MIFYRNGFLKKMLIFPWKVIFFFRFVTRVSSKGFRNSLIKCKFFPCQCQHIDEKRNILKRAHFHPMAVYEPKAELSLWSGVEDQKFSCKSRVALFHAINAIKSFNNQSSACNTLFSQNQWRPYTILWHTSFRSFVMHLPTSIYRQIQWKQFDVFG